MNNKTPCVILVEPQLAENVGMAARAMKNCALRELRLVNPREDHLSAKALSASSNSEEILQQAKVFASTEEAVADLQYVLATTARHRDQTKMVYNADAGAAAVAARLANGEKCGLMFGPERTGLRNEDICLADAIINVPLNPEHCSLNLSQAVLLVGYEWYKTQTQTPEEQFITNATQPATKRQLFKFFEFMEASLADFKNFKDEEKRPTLLRNFHNIFTRSRLTEQELNTLYGIINHLRRK